MEAPAIRAQRLGGMFYAALLRRGAPEDEADRLALELERRLLEDLSKPSELVEREVLKEEGSTCPW